VIETVEPREARRELMHILLPHRSLLTLATVAIVVSTALSLYGPRAIGQVVDEATGQRRTSVVDRAALLLLAATLVAAVLGYVGMYLGTVVGQRAVHQLRVGSLRDAAHLPLNVVEQVGPGQLVSRTTGDTRVVGTMFEVLPWVAVQFVSIVLTVIALVLLSPWLALTSLVSVPVVIAISRWFLPRSRTVYAAEREELAGIADVVYEHAAGAPTARAYGVTERSRVRLAAATGRFYTVAMHGTRLRNVFNPVMMASEYLATVCVIVVGNRLLGNGDIGLGAVTAAALYQVRLAEPLNFIVESLDELQRSTAALARIVGLRRTAQSTTVDGSPVTLPDCTIQCADLRFSYRTGAEVLRGVTLTIEPGERVALVGASGAGKSTLAKVLSGVHDASSGTVTIGGRPVEDFSPLHLRRVIALVTQEAHVFGPTVADDLRLARPDASDDALWAALCAVGADTWVHAFPNGLDEAIGLGGRRLDPAEAQQLALARLVVADPQVVVLDEATASLDLRSARTVEASLQAALAGRTVIAVTHRLGEAEGFDRVITIGSGVVTSDLPKVEPV
jgi:ATP-binding cassette, subfamily C, bacterial